MANVEESKKSNLNDIDIYSLLTTIPIPALIWGFQDGEFFLKNCNEAAQKLVKYEVDKWKETSAKTLFKNSKGVIGSLRACYDFNHSVESEGWFKFNFSETNKYYRMRYSNIGNDLVIMYIEDITKEVEIEEDVQLYFKTAIDMLCITGFDGFFKKLSKTWSLTLGWDEDTLLSRQYTEFIHEDDLASTKMAFEALKEGGIVVGFTNRFLCEDGTYKWLEWNSNANFERGIIISAARDVTVQKKAERALKESIKAADEANKAKSEFLANMSHEIRTPLNAVIGFSELLKGQVVDDHLKEYVESINTSGKNLLALINDILDLSKLEAGMFGLNMEEVNIIRCFNEVERMFSQKIKDKNLTYKFHISPEVPHDFRLDETRFKQVLLNIIGNAIKFTNQGEISVTVDIEKYTQDNNTADLLITIEDTGLGIKNEELNYIFESFTQTGDAKMRFKGSGLGLTISKRLVNLMNGEITVESEFGRGTQFIIRYNGVEITGSSTTTSARTDDDMDIIFEPATILVVDDDDVNRFLIREILINRNINLHEAKDGHEAINAISLVEPDLILMDIKLPMLSGYEAAKIIRKSEKESHVPIIALTASVSFEEANTKMSGLFDAVITKPISIKELLRILSGFLEYKNVNKDKPAMVVSEMDMLEDKKLNVMSPVKIETWIFRLKALVGAIKLTDVYELSEELAYYSNETRIALFLKWSKLLKKYADDFEIDEINLLLNQMIADFEVAYKEADYV